MTEPDYRYKAREFRQKTEIGPEFRDLDHAVQGHWRVAKEEFDELDDEVDNLMRAYEITNDGSVNIDPSHYDRVAEEIADVLVTIHVLADMLGIDAQEAYNRKMAYNMRKTSEKDDDGKVTDDNSGSKPGFRGCHDER